LVICSHDIYQFKIVEKLFYTCYNITMTIQQDILQLLPAKRKSSPSGWISFNALCCHHNGESADTRSRGGMIPSADGAVSYHCFNCGFKTGWRPGWHISYKFRKLLRWMGADDNTIQRLVIEAVRVKDTVAPETIPATDIATIDFKPRPLPPDSASMRQWATTLRLGAEWDDNGIADVDLPPQLATAVNYLFNRGAQHFDKNYEWYISEDQAYNMHRRLIIPFYWQDRLIGYSARAIEEGVSPKFHSSYEPNYVFNVNRQQSNSKFVIVCEGPFDAISVDGVAILGNRVSEQQADIIDSLAREVIVVPDWDFDNKGKWTGRMLVDDAIEYGWSVSFPVWRETCKDINEALIKYGKLFVIKSILDSVEKSRLKIELIKKRIHTS
jgi:hypothetical protein